MGFPQKFLNRRTAVVALRDPGAGPDAPAVHCVFPDRRGAARIAAGDAVVVEGECRGANPDGRGVVLIGCRRVR